MNIIIRQINFFIDILKKFLGIDSGEFYVSNGKHEIFIPTKTRPSLVWFHAIPQGLIEGCGQIPINTITYTTNCLGITFDLDIKTNSCKIEWFSVE